MPSDATWLHGDGVDDGDGDVHVEDAAVPVDEPGAEPEPFHPSDAFQPWVRPVRRVRWDDDEDDPEQTTYTAAVKGPSPVPDWVITSDAARQHELGELKSGKEADVHLVRRTHGERVNLLAAKRYLTGHRRRFKNDARYRTTRRTGDRRADRAMAAGSRAGMAMRAQQWATAEFELLGRLWAAGVAVPYPVQMLGTEVMLEFLGTDDGVAAPRLVDVRLPPGELTELCDQAVTALRLMVAEGIVHADLSPYNVLVHDGRLWVIDLPQAVDPQLGLDAVDLLHRDVTNLIGWFAKRGVPCEPEEVFADVLADLPW